MSGRSLTVLVLAVLHAPFLVVRRLIPADPDLWLFGAWFGDRFGDNSRALFEYASREEGGPKCVWLSSNAQVCDQVRSQGFQAASPYSLRGYWLSLRAGVGIVSNSHRDLNAYIQPRLVVNLWHGFPLKRIWSDNRHEGQDRWTKRLAMRVLPTLGWTRMSAAIALSDEHAALMASAFQLDRTDVWVTGYPRNDALRSTDAASEKPTLLYLPTFRDRSGFSVVDALMSEGDSITAGLSRLGAQMMVSMHPADLARADLTLPAGVRLARSVGAREDLADLLNQADLLVTDYSSVYVDFLLTGKPIIFAPFDLDSYLAEDRDLYYEYGDVTPGPKARSWPEVLEAAEQLLTDRTRFKPERDALRARWHEHADASSSKRVFERVQALSRENG